MVGAGRGEGRSWLAANLAVLFSQLGERTLLIDCDLRFPRQQSLFRLGPAGGLASRLAERGEKVDYVQVWRFAHAEGLSFKKKRPSRRAIEAEGRPAAGAVEEVSGTA